MADLDKDTFILRGIDRMKVGKAKSVHTVWSGLNEAYREYFKEEPVPQMHDMADRGLVVLHPTKGGFRIYRAEDVPDKIQTALDTILAD